MAARDAFWDALAEDDPVRLYEQAPCGFLSTTPDGVIIKANATLGHWLGVPTRELFGRSFVSLLTPGGRIYHETHYAPMLRMHATVRELALELVRADGRRIPVLVNATLDSDADGAPRVVRIAVFDASERRRYERELLAAAERAEASEQHARELVRALQHSMLPPTEPRIPGLDLAAAYRPSVDDLLVGGDFYDVFPLGPEEWGLMLGDVCGKGAVAADITSLVRWTLRAAMVANPEPSTAMAQLNEVLGAREAERFCTAVLVRLHRANDRWQATMCVAGHPPPLLTGDGPARAAVAPSSPVVGVIEHAEFNDTVVALAPGQGLLFYTDGVTEARTHGEFFGEERLMAAADRLGARPCPLVDGLVEEVLGFQDGAPGDDIAVLALQVPPAPPQS